MNNRYANASPKQPMTTEQTRVDVLRRDALHAEAYRLAHGYVGGTLADASKESDAAIAAVTELLAADREYDARLRDFNNTSATLHVWPQMHERWIVAQVRRAAALAAFAPQRAGQEAS